MNKQILVIKGRLPSMNDYTNDNRTSRYKGNNVKQNAEQMIIGDILINKIKVVCNFPITLNITWFESDLRRDSDNINSGVKFICDALVKAKIIPNDSRKYVTDISHKVRVDRDNPRIEVTINEYKEVNDE